MAFLLTPGQAADCRAAEILLRDLPHDALVIADRAYDTDPVRAQIQARGAVPNIPPKRIRRWKHCFSPVLYRGRSFWVLLRCCGGGGGDIACARNFVSHATISSAVSGFSRRSIVTFPSSVTFTFGRKHTT